MCDYGIETAALTPASHRVTLLETWCRKYIFAKYSGESESCIWSVKESGTRIFRYQEWKEELKDFDVIFVT